MLRIACLLFFCLLFSPAIHSQEQSRRYTIGFAKNRSDLTAGNKSLLSSVIDTLKLKSNYKIYINGHADSDADSNYNIQLSLKRSLIVREHFIQSGIDEMLIFTRAMGEDQPLVKNSTPLAKAKNRRVEVVILYEEPPAALIAEADTGLQKKTAGCIGDTLVELNDGFRLEISKCDWKKNEECLHVYKRLTYNYIYKESWLKKHIGFKNYKKYIKQEPHYEFTIVSCTDSCFSDPVKLFIPQHQAVGLDIKQRYSQKKNNKGASTSLSFKKEKRGDSAYYTAQVHCPGLLNCGFDNRCGHLVSLKTRDNISILEYSYYVKTIFYVDSLVTARPSKPDLLTDNYQHSFFKTLVLVYRSDTIILRDRPIDIFPHGSKKIKSKGNPYDKKYILFIPFNRKYKCGHYKKYKLRAKDIEYLRSFSW